MSAPRTRPRNLERNYEKQTERRLAQAYGLILYAHTRARVSQLVIRRDKIEIVNRKS